MAKTNNVVAHINFDIKEPKETELHNILTCLGRGTHSDADCQIHLVLHCHGDGGKMLGRITDQGQKNNA
jgi:hypothetical protein